MEEVDRPPLISKLSIFRHLLRSSQTFLGTFVGGVVYIPTNNSRVSLVIVTTVMHAF